MRLKLLNFALIGIMSLVFTSCIKDDVEDLGDTGRTFLKILESPENKIFFEPFSTIRPVDLFSLRRDANSNAELNKPVTVTLLVDTAAITAYNLANGTDFELLPDSLFTLGSGITKTGPLTYQLTLQPGEFAKDFTINLDGAKWDLAYKYAMPFTITDGGGIAIQSGREDVIALISIKNRWDGIYTITGTMVDLAVPTLTGWYPLEWHLVTLNETQVVVVDEEWLGFPGHLINNGGSPSYYGSFGLIVTFDPVTNAITSVTNYYGQPSGNGRSAALDPTGVNAYDPTTGTIQIKYFMLQPGSTVRTTFDETWKFDRPR